MALACSICIMRKGLRGSEIGALPQNEAELAEHMERVHHTPVIRNGETEEQAIKRFLETYPDARNCPECRKAGAKWAPKPSDSKQAKRETT